jgi:hypothetical protein
MLTQEQFNSLLLPVIYHHFDLGQSRVPSMRGQLFNVDNSMLSEERGTGMGGISPDAWDQYNKSGIKGRLGLDQLYTQSYIHIEYPVELEIQKKLLLNDQYGKVNDLIQRAGMSANQKMEIDAASLLNNAFSAGKTWSDGKPLCATDHPKGPNGGGTYSNKGTAVLSSASLSAARIAMMRFKDDKESEIGVMPNELWVAPELEDTAIEITKSLNDPATANNAVNPQAARWAVKPWMRLTDTNNWFITDSAWRETVVKWYNREALQVMLTRETTTELVYELKLHYSFGVDDWRWIFGSEVVGA